MKALIDSKKRVFSMVGSMLNSNFHVEANKLGAMVGTRTGTGTGTGMGALQTAKLADSAWMRSQRDGSRDFSSAAVAAAASPAKVEGEANDKGVIIVEKSVPVLSTSIRQRAENTTPSNASRAAPSSSSLSRLEALRIRLQQEEEEEEGQESGVDKRIGALKLDYFEKKNENPPRSSGNPISGEDDNRRKTKKLDVFDILDHLRRTSSSSQSSTFPDSADERTNTLVDRFKRRHSYLRISLVERCNLRCRYCMPEEGLDWTPHAQLLTRPEIVRLARVFVRNGVNKIRLTGGEPLLRPDLVDIVRDLRNLNDEFGSATTNPTTNPTTNRIRQIGMTTNGITLSRKLDDLIRAGLTHVNISLDTLRPDRFEDMTRRSGWDKVWRSIEDACEKLSHGGGGSGSGTSIEAGRVKLNCVVMKDVNDDELVDFCRLTKQYPIDVRFIEWMPFYQNQWNQNRFVSYQEMLTRVQNEVHLERAVDGPNDTTKWWTLCSSRAPAATATAASALGRIGFITSMSSHFCSTCNRLRMTADGNIKVCLFDGMTEISLRDALRGRQVDVVTTGESCQQSLTPLSAATAASSGLESGSGSTSYAPRGPCTDEELVQLVRFALQRKQFALGGFGNAQGIANHSDTNRPMTLIGG